MELADDALFRHGSSTMANPMYSPRLEPIQGRKYLAPHPPSSPPQRISPLQMSRQLQCRGKSPSPNPSDSSPNISNSTPFAGFSSSPSLTPVTGPVSPYSPFSSPGLDNRRRLTKLEHKPINTTNEDTGHVLLDSNGYLDSPSSPTVLPSSNLLAPLSAMRTVGNLRLSPVAKDARSSLA